MIPVIRGRELILSKFTGCLEEYLFSCYAEIFSQHLLRTEFTCHFPHDRCKPVYRMAAVKLPWVSVCVTHLKPALQTNHGLVIMAELGTPRHQDKFRGQFSQGL